MLLPVESTLEVTRALGAAKFAVAWRAMLETDCWGAGTKAAAVDNITAAKIMHEKDRNI
jgi:hypothetical protein